MVQVVENRTDLEGVVVGRAPHPELADYDVLDVDVQEAKPVEGMADLLSSRVGSRIALNVRRSLLPAGPIEGQRLHSRAYLGGPGAIFADKDPSPGAFSLAP